MGQTAPNSNNAHFQCFVGPFCAPGLLYKKPSVKNTNSLLFSALPAGHSPPSVWYKSSPAHREPARVQSSDAPGTHSQYHSEKQAQQRQMQSLQTTGFLFL